MMASEGSSRAFNLQPHPRILPMLGEITLPQWRCLAELVDNGIDSFLAAQRQDHAIQVPEIIISIPTSDDPNSRISVRDNGPGMDIETLGNAVKAGWTGNDPINNLGLFGMGFNIATARLGTITKVWTTKEGDQEWYGLEIDFKKLVSQKHYSTPLITRPKTEAHEHGSEICIEHMKPEQRLWFAKAANRSQLKNKLSRVYSSMLRVNGFPISFQLKLNGSNVEGTQHCIWGGEGNPIREVVTSRFGIVDAYQPINSTLGERPFCMTCWQWLSAGERLCPECESSENIIQRERIVRGWLGIQRYFDASEFGIDFLRQGRKIEVANKDLFIWSDSESSELEYPIDDPRRKGRIVGEIHIDHCRVTYSKDRFDRDDPSWESMVRVLRGDGPLRPEKAAQLGYENNTTPLFLLFQAFRRSTPKPRVAGCYEKLLAVPDNDTALDFAKRFYAGEPEFQTDEKWWNLLIEADAALLTPTQKHDICPPGALSELLDMDETTGESHDDSQGDHIGREYEEHRDRIASLSKVFQDDITKTQWNVDSFSVLPSDTVLGGEFTPWTLRRTTAGITEYYVNPNHSVFSSATMTPLDALLYELAFQTIELLKRDPDAPSVVLVLTNLRDKYASVSKLDPVVLSVEASSTLNAIARSVSNGIESGEGRVLFDELSPGEKEAVQKKMATRGVPNPQQTIDDGRFLEFAPRKTLIKFFENHAELFFDGKYWRFPFATLDYENAAANDEARGMITRNYLALLMDAAWLADQDAGDLTGATRERLLRAALALVLLDEDTSSEN